MYVWLFQAIDKQLKKKKKSCNLLVPGLMVQNENLLITLTYEHGKNSQQLVWDFFFQFIKKIQSTVVQILAPTI